MRQYKILSETTATTLEEDIRQKALTFKNVQIEGFAFDGTNYVALLSYETEESTEDSEDS